VIRPRRAGVLGEAESTVGLRFDNGIADVLQMRNRFPIHLAVSTGRLRAALNRVSRDGAGGEPVPIVGLPSELVNHGREGKARVGDAAGDDDLRAFRQRVHYWPCAEVDIRASHVRGERPARGSPVVHALQLDAAGGETRQGGP